MITNISAAQIKELRDKTGAGMLDCRQALIDAGGEIQKALLLLRERGILLAEKKASRETTEGRIEAYVHLGGKIGTLVELSCETDFVAKTDAFKDLARNLAMQVTASNPGYLTRQEIPPEFLEQEKEVYAIQAEREGKSGQAAEKFVEGKVEKLYQAICLLDQPYIRDPERTVQDVIKEAIAKLGENVVVRRFVRFSLGEKEG